MDTLAHILTATTLALPSYVIFIVAIVIAAISAYIGAQIGKGLANRYNYVVGDLDTLAARLTEAEKIGRFGSFTWDFEDPTASYWSEELYALLDLDYQRTPPTPEAFINFADPASREAAIKAWELARIKSGSFSFSFRAISKTGRAMYLKVQGKMIPARGKGPKQLQGVVTDVTREKEVDRAKSEFVTLASHQLKTPLTSLRWLSEGLLKGSAGSLSSQQEQYVANMHDASMRMITMVNDLLNVSRIETDTLAIRPEDMDICELAHNVVVEQQPFATQKRLAISLECERDLPHMNADAGLVRMVLQNIISNAIKYTPEGGSVTCDISSVRTTRDSILVRVRDTGIGIPSAEQSRVFEKLHRASNAEHMVADGTGLGLYLVKTIVDKVGGGVTFESVEGRGTTFYVSMPVIWKAHGDKPLA